MTLGLMLKTARLKTGRTLRQLESETGISNGYLSQLESDAIKRPSPHHLHKLASTLALSYRELMELAGYVPEPQVAAISATSGLSIPLALDDLTAEDRRKIAAYIEDLRDARRQRGA